MGTRDWKFLLRGGHSGGNITADVTTAAINVYDLKSLAVKGSVGTAGTSIAFKVLDENDAERGTLITLSSSGAFHSDWFTEFSGKVKIKMENVGNWAFDENVYLLGERV
jgi:hypothetical protein|tara:strand:- start:4371 stop:4697 length:327 start_codon:yes stop_codon:yes gene_type:complete